MLTLGGLSRVQESTDLAAHNAVSIEWLKFDQYMAGQSDLRPYFYEGRPLTGAEVQLTEKVKSVALYALNFADYAVTTVESVESRTALHRKRWGWLFGSTQANFSQAEPTREYLRLTLFRSPAICAALNQLKGGYSESTHKLATPSIATDGKATGC